MHWLGVSLLRGLQGDSIEGQKEGAGRLDRENSNHYSDIIGLGQSIHLPTADEGDKPGTMGTILLKALQPLNPDPYP